MPAACLGAAGMSGVFGPGCAEPEVPACRPAHCASPSPARRLATRLAGNTRTSAAFGLGADRLPRGTATRSEGRPLRYAAPGEAGSLVTFKLHYDNFIGETWTPPVRGEYFANPSPMTGQPFCEVAALHCRGHRTSPSTRPARRPRRGRTSRANASSRTGQRRAGGPLWDPLIVAAMPNAAAQKAYIGRLFDRAAASYDRVGNALFAPAGAALAAAAALRPGDRVLDVGCGRGAALFPAAEAVGVTGSVTGIDLAAAMVAATAADITRRGVANASVRVGDAESPISPTALSMRCWPASSCSFCRTYRRRCVLTYGCWPGRPARAEHLRRAVRSRDRVRADLRCGGGAVPAAATDVGRSAAAATVADRRSRSPAPSGPPVSSMCARTSVTSRVQSNAGTGCGPEDCAGCWSRYRRTGATRPAPPSSARSASSVDRRTASP